MRIRKKGEVEKARLLKIRDAKVPSKLGQPFLLLAGGGRCRSSGLCCTGLSWWQDKLLGKSLENTELFTTCTWYSSTFSISFFHATWIFAWPVIFAKGALNRFGDPGRTTSPTRSSVRCGGKRSTPMWARHPMVWADGWIGYIIYCLGWIVISGVRVVLEECCRLFHVVEIVIDFFDFCNRYRKRWSIFSANKNNPTFWRSTALFAGVYFLSCGNQRSDSDHSAVGRSWAKPHFRWISRRFGMGEFVDSLWWEIFILVCCWIYLCLSQLAWNKETNFEICWKLKKLKTQEMSIQTNCESHKNHRTGTNNIKTSQNKQRIN